MVNLKKAFAVLDKYFAEVSPKEYVDRLRKSSPTGKLPFDDRIGSLPEMSPRMRRRTAPVAEKEQIDTRTFPGKIRKIARKRSKKRKS